MNAAGRPPLGRPSSWRPGTLPRMRIRSGIATLPLAVAIAFAASAIAQTPGLVPGVHHLHLKGIGKVRFGMTVKEARDAAGVHMVKSRVNQCTYLDAGPPGTGQGPTLMFVGGKFRVVTTRRPRREFSTPKGVGVGTRLRRVRRLYPGAERTVNIGAPQGFNLVWKRGHKRRFVFEISNGKVFGIKSGVMPYVKWQECA
jgi:hypothetical protein